MLKFGFRGLAATIAAVALPSAARAAYVLDIRPVGTGVVATGSGSLNTAALRVIQTYTSSDRWVIGRSAGIAIGSDPGATLNNFGDTTTRSSFGSGPLVGADNTSGTVVGAAMNVGRVQVRADYVSASPLGTSTATWNNTSLAGLGLTQGTYVTTWGSGPTADSFTINIVPEPSAACAGVGFCGLILARRRRAR